MKSNIKNTILMTAGLACLFVFSSVGARAQTTATGHIFAEVIDAITAVESSSMSFGQFSTGDQGGSITVPCNGGAITTDAIVPTGNSITPATFRVSGARDAAFTVSLPDGPTTLTSLTGNGTMTVSGWNATSAQGSDSYILAGGTQMIKVGATLKVGSPDQNPKGVYTGSYKVTFDYN
jgi:hypothetical protein